MSSSLWYSAMLLGAVVIGWALASKHAAKVRMDLASDFERIRSDFESKVSELEGLLVDQETELTTSRALLDELRIKAAIASEQHIRVDTLRESERSIAIARDEDFASLKAMGTY